MVKQKKKRIVTSRRHLHKGKNRLGGEGEGVRENKNFARKKAGEIGKEPKEC